MKIPTGLVPKAERFLKKASPTILTCIRAAGVVARRGWCRGYRYYGGQSDPESVEADPLGQPHQS